MNGNQDEQKKPIKVTTLFLAPTPLIVRIKKDAGKKRERILGILNPLDRWFKRQWVMVPD